MKLGRISSAVLLFMLMQGGAHGQAEVAEHDLSRWALVIERGDSSEIASALAEVARTTERKEDIPALRESLQPALIVLLKETEAQLMDAFSEEAVGPESLEWLTEQKAQTLAVLTSIADERAMDALIQHLGTGRMVAEWLISQGLPAVEPVLARMETDPRARVPGAYVLPRILADSRSDNSEAEMLFRTVVVPRVEVLILRLEEEVTAVGRAREISLEALREAVRIMRSDLST